MNLRFLTEIFLDNSLSASFQQHKKVYQTGISDHDKKIFQSDFKNRLRNLTGLYSTHVSGENHCNKIIEFKVEIQEAHHNILQNGVLRVGTAQKAINLYLKFLWSIDLICEPPHCPIDRNVLQAIESDLNWTEIDDIIVYQEIIKLIRKVADPLTPSVWENNLWLNIRR